MMATRPRCAWGSVSFLTTDILANKRSLIKCLRRAEPAEDRGLREQLADPLQRLFLPGVAAASSITSMPSTETWTHADQVAARVIDPDGDLYCGEPPETDEHDVAAVDIGEASDRETVPSMRFV